MAFAFGVVAWFVVWTAIGTLLGARRGRPVAGPVAGFLLGPIGVVALLLSPTGAELAENERAKRLERARRGR